MVKLFKEFFIVVDLYVYMFVVIVGDLYMCICDIVGENVGQVFIHSPLHCVIRIEGGRIDVYFFILGMWPGCGTVVLSLRNAATL